MFAPDVALDALPDWIALVDAGGVVRYANRALAAAFSAQADELIGKRCHELFHAGGGPIADCPYARSVQGSGKTEVARLEIPGHGCFVLTCAPLRNARGEIVGSVHQARQVAPKTEPIAASQSESAPGAPTRIDGVAQDHTTLLEPAEPAEALRRQAGFYRLILDAIPAPVFEKDARGVYRECNAAFAEFLGRPREAIIDRTVFDVAPTELATKYHEADAELLARGGEQVYESVVLGAGNQKRRVEFRKATLTDENGRVAGLIGVILDITDLRQAEERLSESEAFLRGLVDTMPNGCAVYEVRGKGTSGADYVVKDVNRASLQMEGKARQQVVGKSLKDLRPNIGEQGLVAALRRVWLTGEPERLPAQLYQDDRLNNWYDNNLFRLPTGEVVDVYRDITAEKRIEIALRKSEAEQRAIFDLVGVPMLLMDTRGRILRWNRALQKALGYASQELRGFSARDLTVPEERPAMLRRLSVALTGGEGRYRIERRCVAKDGSLPWFDVSVTPVVNDDGEVTALIAAGTDIGEARRARQLLIESRNRLREALSETVAAMGAIVALRDPYTAGHERRVTELAVAIATEMGLGSATITGLRHAASVHDVGKIAVPSEILSKPSRLSSWEYSLVMRHPQVGDEVLSGIAFEQPVAEIVLQHHERLDGSGYPHGLEGDAIMLEARILAVADVVEAMASHRPYRPALGVDSALAEIEEAAGRAFDTTVVEACARVLRAGLVDLSETAE